MLPSRFPSNLGDAAFIVGDDAGWPLSLAAEAVNWLKANNYAVLGTELWAVNNGRVSSLPMGQRGLPECHGNTVNRELGEEWQAFVRRCGAETLAYLQCFNPAEISEEGELYFNIIWVNEEEFGNLKIR
jgi:hypothetical protein